MVENIQKTGSSFKRHTSLLDFHVKEIDRRIDESEIKLGKEMNG